MCESAYLSIIFLCVYVARIQIFAKHMDFMKRKKGSKRFSEMGLLCPLFLT